MVKRDITETIYEYDSEGKLVRKTVTETHEEEEDRITTSSYQTYPRDIVTTPCNGMEIVKLLNEMTISNDDGIHAVSAKL